MATRVGFIGLGLMGRPMGLNLLKAGFPLTVWNRTRARTEALAAAGAAVAASAREVAERSDVVITIVSDPPALEAVLWGADGVLGSLKRGALLIDSSTVSPALARRVAADCAQRGVDFLDAPVTGGTWGAEKGELVFMIGGKSEVLERARPVFEAMGKRFFHLGDNGAGQTVKLAMNLILALQVQALCEALALVGGSGIPGQKLVEVMQASMARAPVLDVKAPLILGRKYAPSFPLRLMHKDMGLALELGNQTGVPLPAAAAAREVYNKVLGAAKEDVDFAAIARFWEK
ncbi:MAG TPA: NAD(P)-dependent oxidoreductase [Candidatus Acidoferrales bacterium]|nr:NAD(P)-dependent oxidoreductase [Candidatus Acidoferrales bacterium]